MQKRAEYAVFFLIASYPPLTIQVSRASLAAASGPMHRLIAGGLRALVLDAPALDASYDPSFLLQLAKKNK